MESRIIIPSTEGDVYSYDLRVHHSGSREELKIVLNTSEETFERWLFYRLRDVGAHIVTNDRSACATCLVSPRANPASSRKVTFRTWTQRGTS